MNGLELSVELEWRSTGHGSKLEQQSTGHGSIQAWTAIDGHVEAVLRQTNAKSLSNQKRCKFTCACAHMCNTPGFANGSASGVVTPPDWQLEECVDASRVATGKGMENTPDLERATEEAVR